MLLLTLITCHYAGAFSSIHKNRVVYCHTFEGEKKINYITVQCIYMESDVHESKEFKGSIHVFCFLYRNCTNVVIVVV